ncbi:class I SAM-dependent methyltransferase [soil metagenome]
MDGSLSQRLAAGLADPAIGIPEQALLTLTDRLRALGYSFITPTPAAHRKVISRFTRRERGNLRDIFGWNLRFSERDLDPDLLALMEAAGIVERKGSRLKSRLRLASLGDHLFWHSAFPAKEEDAVFFGPDTYRYAELIRSELPSLGPNARMVDIGAGSGAGGLVAGALAPQAEVILADINPRALRLARLNAVIAGIPVQITLSDGLAGVTGPIDLAMANPPYLGGGVGRTYRDGGGILGAGLSLAWAKASAERLVPGGTLILYTGSAIVRGGKDRVLAALRDICAAGRCSLRYRELDPDVFSGMLAHPAYWHVERIAAVGAVVVKQG